MSVPSPAFLRRALVLLMVEGALANLAGCATPAEVCDVRQDYRSSAIPTKGEVRVTWEVKPLPAGTYGYATCDRTGKNCHIEMTSKPDYNDVCRLADFSHEMLHAMGVGHN
jgi:hypothetical protein